MYAPLSSTEPNKAEIIAGGWRKREEGGGAAVAAAERQGPVADSVDWERKAC